MPGIQNSKKTLDFLGTIGSTDRGDGVTLNNTAAALVELAEFLITEGRRNLEKNGNTATGETATSMIAGPLQTNTNKMHIDISIASTYKFLNDGVKGVEGGTGKYQFKTKRVSKKMALAILKWIKRRRVVSKYKAYSSKDQGFKGRQVGKTERKNKAIKALSNSAESQKSLAYAIAANIKKKGIRPTKFFTNAIEATKRERKERFAKALKLDIIESLNSN